MTPEEAFAIYLNYAPELEFLNGGDREDKAFTESILAIVPDIADRKIFLNEARRVYDLAIQGFFDQIATPFEKKLKDFVVDKYVVTSRHKKRIETYHSWSIKSKNKSLLFQVGFLFRATQGKCVATPWFWRNGNKIKLNREEIEEVLNDEFSTPHAANWDPAALIAKSVEYGSTDNIEQLNKNLMSPISFALNEIVSHIERQEKSHKLRNN